MSDSAPEQHAATTHNRAYGVDIGGTSTRIALVDRIGRILHFAGTHTPADGDAQELAATLRRLASEIASQVLTAPPLAGVALPGIRDASGDVMERAVNLPRLEGVNVRDLCQRALGCTVRLETDVNAAGWAQWRALEPRPNRFVYLSLGTGVGGCVILDGRIVRHTHDGPGHFGHLIVDSAADAPLCSCSARGCLEACVRSAVQADIQHAVRALTIGLSQIAHLYAPDTIALGGGVVEHHNDLVARAREMFREMRGRLVPESISIETAPLKTDEAGVIGAALLALRAAS